MLALLTDVGPVVTDREHHPLNGPTRPTPDPRRTTLRADLRRICSNPRNLRSPRGRLTRRWPELPGLACLAYLPYLANLIWRCASRLCPRTTPRGQTAPIGSGRRGDKSICFLPRPARLPCPRSARAERLELSIAIVAEQGANKQDSQEYWRRTIIVPDLRTSTGWTNHHTKKISPHPKVSRRHI